MRYWNVHQKQHRGMKFSCSEQWEHMEPRGNDRFCTSCQKEVIDFTDWDLEALRAYFREKPNSCGQFRPEQVETDLVPLSDKLRPMRTGLFATLTAFMIQSTAAQEPAPVNVEMNTNEDVVPGSYLEKAAMNGAVIKMRSDGPICVVQEPVARRRARYGVYVSGRFPFIHVRNRRIRGRVMGCPTF